MTSVQFSEGAAAHVEDIVTWLRVNGRDADHLLDDLQSVTMLLASSPRVGVAFGRTRKRSVRRVLMREHMLHVYDVYRDQPDVVLVVAIWSARRGRGPRLVVPTS